MKKGEIYLINLVGSGNQQIGLRPVVVYSKVVGNLVIIVPMTSNLDALRYNATCKVKKSLVNNLGVDSVALIFQLRAINVSNFGRKIGKLNKEDLDFINRELREFLDLK